MSAPDPHSRSLRGALSAAVRAGDREAEAMFRRELALQNLERAFVRELGEQPLNAVELRRLRKALDAHGPSSVRPAEQTGDDAAVAV